MTAQDLKEYGWDKEHKQGVNISKKEEKCFLLDMKKGERTKDM